MIMSIIFNKPSKLREWLKKYNDNDIEFYESQYDFLNYYDEPDTNLNSIDSDIVEITNPLMHNGDSDLSDDDFESIDDNYVQKYDNYVQKYDNYNVYIYPHMNLYNSDMLFRKITDEVLKNNMSLSVPVYNTETNKYDFIEDYIFNKNMKKSFYEFIKNHT